MESKKLKEKESSGFKRVSIGIIVLLLIAVSALITVFNDDRQENQVTSGSSAVVNSTLETSQVTDGMMIEERIGNEKDILSILEFKNGEIQTPYLTLYYPESFEEYLLIANSCRDPYMLEFYAIIPNRMEQKIFEVCLGTDFNGNMGVVTTDKGEISVSMTIYSVVTDDTWSESEIDTIFAMQEAVNELIWRLGISSNNAGNSDLILKKSSEENNVINFLKIETPYCVLPYPAVWADRLYIEQIETIDTYRVEFYCKLEEHEPLLMFTVIFGGDEGEQLGVIIDAEENTIPVNIIMNAPSKDGLVDEELDTLYSMQEALNQLIQQLPLS